MGLRIIHISDTHGKEELLDIPPCNILVHTGDIGGRTNIAELMKFLVWFEKQPADRKIFIGGNHDIVLSKDWIAKEEAKGSVEGLLAKQFHYAAMELIQNYNVTYLKDREFIYEGLK